VDGIGVTVFSGGNTYTSLAQSILFSGGSGGSVESLSDEFTTNSGTQYFVKSSGAYGNFAYSNMTTPAGSTAIDPQVTVTKYAQGPSTGAILNWIPVSTSQTMKTATGYIATSGTLVLTLPVSSSVGQLLSVSLEGATSWQIAQNAGQQIRMGNTLTTSGTGGSLSSTAQGDTVTLVCSVSSTNWFVWSSQGNITVT
jgi:hypothetical protein